MRHPKVARDHQGSAGDAYNRCLDGHTGIHQSHASGNCRWKPEVGAVGAQDLGRQRMVVGEPLLQRAVSNQSGVSRKRAGLHPRRAGAAAGAEFRADRIRREVSRMDVTLGLACRSGSSISWLSLVPPRVQVVVAGTAGSGCRILPGAVDPGQNAHFSSHGRICCCGHPRACSSSSSSQRRTTPSASWLTRSRSALPVTGRGTFQPSNP